MKYLLNKDSLFATLFVYIVILIFYLIPLNINFLDPLEQALSDFELTDIVFSKMREKESVKGDTNIVLVNIGNLSRRGIADEIKIIN
ncbi:hypothetical protein JYT51_00445, partial [Candidatus Amoebophilus asiaticus]|nr:hypothetical protein [Candidatus Amoebophilus asiaticus]